MAVIRGERVSLREVREEDNPLFRRWRSDPEVLRWLFSERAPTEAEQQHWFESLASDETKTAFMVETATGRAIGQAKFDRIDRERGCAELGLMIGERAERGKGLGAEACRLLIQYGFEELALRRIDCLVLADNEPALGLYRKLGFREGDASPGPVLKDGRSCDVVRLSLLAPDKSA